MCSVIQFLQLCEAEVKGISHMQMVRPDTQSEDHGIDGPVRETQPEGVLKIIKGIGESEVHLWFPLLGHSDQEGGFKLVFSAQVKIVGSHGIKMSVHGKIGECARAELGACPQ